MNLLLLCHVTIQLLSVVIVSLSLVPIINGFTVSTQCKVKSQHYSAYNNNLAYTTREFDVSRNRRGYYMVQKENDVPPPTSSSSSSQQQQQSINDDVSSIDTSRITEKIMDPSTRAVVDAAAKRKQQELIDNDPTQQQQKKFPIDLPSPILLASSMILAIISTGCLFQLFDTSSDTSSFELGFAPTLAIVLIGIPSCLFLLYASITKATAETEADDQAFLSGKKK